MINLDNIYPHSRLFVFANYGGLFTKFFII